MAGCSSGRLQYIVASEGGVAGMGEVLRRVPWKEARVSEDKVVSNLNSADFSRLEEIQRDQWPAR
jgi:hypothetical protein